VSWGRGTAEQWIKEGKYAIRWTWLSCYAFRHSAVRLQLHALAYNLANFMPTLALPQEVEQWSLTRKDLHQGARLRRLARPYAPAELHRRQGAPGQDVEDGAARLATTAHCRRHGRRASGGTDRRCGRILARTHAGAKAAHADRGRAGKPHCARRLGLDDPRRGVQSFGCRSLVLD
jgi:hypothetical protein